MNDITPADSEAAENTPRGFRWFYVSDEPDSGGRTAAGAIAECDDLEVIDLETDFVMPGPPLFVFRTPDGAVHEFASRAEAGAALRAEIKALPTSASTED